MNKKKFNYFGMSDMNIFDNLNISKMECYANDCRDENTGDISDCDNIEFGGNSPYDDPDDCPDPWFAEPEPDDCPIDCWDCNDCRDCFDCGHHGGDCEDDDDF